MKTVITSLLLGFPWGASLLAKASAMTPWLNGD